MSTDKNGPRRSGTTNAPVRKRIADGSSKKDPEEEKKVSKTTAIRSVKGTSKKPDQKLASSFTPNEKPTRNTLTKGTSNLKPTRKLATKTTAPSTSNRVTKSQYFPSKNLFSNALKSVETQPKPPITKSTLKSVETQPKLPIAKNAPASTKSKTVKANKAIKQEKGTPRESSPETSSMLERPRTATLRKGSIVNENIVGPEAPKPFKNVAPIQEARAKSDDSYEDDDFDSYESDFEPDTSSGEDANTLASSSISSSSEDPPPQVLHKTISSAGADGERKLDSGTFELSDSKHRQILKCIEDTMKKDQAILEQQAKGNHPSLSDEGFEDQKSLQFINFAHAKRECDKRRASAVRKKRGEQLLGMIKLDVISFTIFDSPSVSYDVFISNYGQDNCVQASIQTGEDDLSEEVQTDTIIKGDKWTQMPNKFTDFDLNQDQFWARYRTEYLGTGTDELKDLESPITIEPRLTQFVKHSAEVMLQVLAETTMNDMKDIQKNSNNLPFSNGSVRFNTNGEVLHNTTVENISVHPHDTSKVLTVHLKKDSIESIKSVVCIWDVASSECPRTILVSFGRVCCATFPWDNEKYVLAAQEDGSLLVWNVETKRAFYEISSRTPSFVSAIGSGHLSRVVSLQPIPQGPSNITNIPENNEICSLDESGIMIIWTLYTNTDPAESLNEIVLINTQLINFQNVYPQFSNLTCTDCVVMDNHVYVSSSYGFILHHMLKSNQMGIKAFVPENQIEATCLESCPFSPSLFVAGYSNGDLSLFSRTTETPLLVLQNKDELESAGVQMVRWSKTKPFMLYAKDRKNHLHIWDLCKSDMYPEYSIPFPQQISSIALSPVSSAEKEESAYLLIGTENGEIHLHLLSAEYGQQSPEKYREDVKIFLNYVNRL